MSFDVAVIQGTATGFASAGGFCPKPGTDAQQTITVPRGTGVDFLQEADVTVYMHKTVPFISAFDTRVVQVQ